MGFTVETGISAAAVFVQGLLSFFSPCVLPLVPLYLSYLAGGLNLAAESENNQSGVMPGISEKRGKGGKRLRLFLRVLCFTVGISGAFFVLGLGASAAGSFFREQRMLFARIGGILIILFGVYQIGVFGSSRLLGKEHRIPLRLEKMTMSPVTALIMGFTFSFAWTPCVGPALTSVLLMAGSAQTSFKGFLLIGVYTLGFILPFLAAGIFTAQLLGFFRKHMKLSLFDYLLDYRVEQSLPLLREKDLSITQIAEQTGFGGSAYFAKIFKKEMGISPSQYRKSGRNPGAFS